MIELRRLTDVDRLMQWRVEVLGCVFGAPPEPSLVEANRGYYIRHLSDGSHIAYMALLDGEEAGCGAVCIYDEMPSPDNPSGRCAYLMNIYTRAPFRKRGIASRLIDRLVNDAKDLGCGKIYLETTEMGRPLYLSLGFDAMKGFMKYGNERI